MKTTALGLLLVVMTLRASAADLGFRFVDGRCVNTKGEEGLNPDFRGACGDLRQASLVRADLSDLDLSGARFDGADLQRSSLKNSHLTGAVFDAANLSGACLEGAVLHQVKLRRAILRNVQFADADIRASDFSNASMNGVDMSYVQFAESNFSDANLSRSVLEEASLIGANLSGANLENADLEGADLSQADLTSANFSRANLRVAKLRSARGDRSLFTNAVVRGADFTGAELQAVIFRGAKMESANLENADLTSADFRGASLQDANVSRASLQSSKFDAHTALPFSMETARAKEMVEKRVAKALFVAPFLDDSTLAATLEREGIVVEQMPDIGWGEKGIQDYSVVILMGGTYLLKPSQEKQERLVEFVRRGGLLITTDLFFSFSGDTQKQYLQSMQDLLLFDSTSRSQGGGRNIVLQRDFLQHSLLDGVLSNFYVASYFSTGKARTFAESPVQVLATDPNGNDTILLRTFGAGKILAYAFACATVSCSQQPMVQRLFLNAAYD